MNYELRLDAPLDYPSVDRYRGRPNDIGVREPSLAMETVHWSPMLPFGVPAFWIVVDLALLAHVAGKAALSEREQAATALLFSSLLYWAGFLVIGVADSYRYAFYPSIASSVALAMMACDHLDRGAALGRKGRYVAAGIALYGMTLSALHGSIQLGIVA